MRTFRNRGGDCFLAATTNEITAAGFVHKDSDPGNWYLTPGPTEVLGFDDKNARQRKAFNYFHHIHLMTFVADQGDHALRAIKIKSGAEMGWRLKRKADGRFRLTANPEKDEFSAPTRDADFRFNRVAAIFAFIPRDWLTPEKPITGSGTRAIQNRGVG